MGKRYLMQNYAQLPLVITRGQGVRVFDAEGRCYLDFVSGIAVNALGHCHPKVVEAIQKQAEQLIHCSNLYWFEPPVVLARELAALSGLDRVFFCNSGAEANEAAIKLVRKYAYGRGIENPEIITFSRSFHGRTLGTLAATGQEKFSLGFTPLPEGFRHVAFNDVAELKKAVGPQTAGIMLEPLQGEGGVYTATQELMDTLRGLQDRGIPLIFDEVQCGLGRTGKVFAYEHYGVKPDVLTLAKSLGGGLPIGAAVAREEVAAVFQPGSHGSTFGGNPVACAAAKAVLDVIKEDGLAEQAARNGEYMKDRLTALQDRYPIKEVRGLGFLLGMELEQPAGQLVNLCQERGLLVNCTGERVIRFLPPLITTREEIDEALEILEKAMQEFFS
ncbi:MAG: aspartate aminotransferase family protein [Thermoanaerobacterales bacterium]|nr:aspartate aminotransferase family protein [Thermoanaerobacterales bacterium]